MTAGMGARGTLRHAHLTSAYKSGSRADVARIGHEPADRVTPGPTRPRRLPSGRSSGGRRGRGFHVHAARRGFHVHAAGRRFRARAGGGTRRSRAGSGASAPGGGGRRARCAGRGKGRGERNARDQSLGHLVTSWMSAGGSIGGPPARRQSGNRQFGPTCWPGGYSLHAHRIDPRAVVGRWAVQPARRRS